MLSSNIIQVRPRAAGRSQIPEVGARGAEAMRLGVWLPREDAGLFYLHRSPVSFDSLGSFSGHSLQAPPLGGAHPQDHTLLFHTHIQRNARGCDRTHLFLRWDRGEVSRGSDSSWFLDRVLAPVPAFGLVMSEAPHALWILMLARVQTVSQSRLKTSASDRCCTSGLINLSNHVWPKVIYFGFKRQPKPTSLDSSENLFCGDERR